MTAELRELIARGIEAMRLTRDYVGEGTLPALDGWSWYDWTREAEAALASTPEPAPAQPLSFDKSSGKEPAPVAEGLDAERLALALHMLHGDYRCAGKAWHQEQAARIVRAYAAASPSPECERSVTPARCERSVASPSPETE